MNKETVGYIMIGITLLVVMAGTFFVGASEVGYVKASEIAGALAFFFTWFGGIMYCMDRG